MESLNKQFNISSKKDHLSVMDHLAFLPGEIITYPDDKVGWYDYAVQAGDEFFQRKHVDLIFSSSSPATCHLIARTLAEKYSVPWVADLLAHEHFLDFDTFIVATSLSDRPLLIGYIGRLSEEKGVLNFVGSLTSILSDRDDLRALIGGMSS